MLTLGIETSGKNGSVALRVDGKCLEERALDPSGRRHARSLVAEIAEMFQSLNYQIRDTQLVAAGIPGTGVPGVFTRSE